jgi:hypothetical protein
VFFPNTSVYNGEGALLRLMEAMAAANPKAGAFYFHRKQFPRQFPDNKGFVRSNQGGLMARIMRKTSVAPGIGLVGKLIVIPDRIDGIRTHWVREMIPGYAEV